VLCMRELYAACNAARAAVSRAFRFNQNEP